MSDHDEFLNSTMVEENDIIVLLDEGVFRDPEDTGLQRTVFQITISLPDKRRKTWTCNKTSRKRFIKAWGDDSANWVGKQVRITMTNQNVRGEMRDILWGWPVEGETPPKSTTEALKNYDTIVKKILEDKPSLTMKAVEKLVEDERAKAAGLLTEEAAAYLVATSLSVDLGK